MTLPFAIRTPRPGGEHEIAALHVECWRQTYSNLLPANYFGKDPLTNRLQMWTAILANPEPRRLAVAEQNDQLIGFAIAAPAVDAEAARDLRLYAIYLDASHYGCGAGQALLDTVVGNEPAELWVAEENPRANSFYRRNGSVPDGARIIDEDGITEIRLVRGRQRG